MKQIYRRIALIVTSKPSKRIRRNFQDIGIKSRNGNTPTRIVFVSTLSPFPSTLHVFSNSTSSPSYTVSPVAVITNLVRLPTTIGTISKSVYVAESSTSCQPVQGRHISSWGGMARGSLRVSGLSSSTARKISSSLSKVVSNSKGLYAAAVDARNAVSAVKNCFIWLLFFVNFYFES